MNKIRIYDFEDSFTFNIASTLFSLGYSTQIYSFKSLEADLKKKHLSSEKFILGPGPGRPEAHSNLYKILKTKIMNNYKILGICLGHQIILNSFGYKVRASNNPIHGFVEKLTLDEYWQSLLEIYHSEINVQRYNSLEITNQIFPKSKIKTLLKEDVIYASSYQNCITYQFHPESIGTKKKKKFFESFLKL